MLTNISLECRSSNSHTWKPS